MKFDTKFSAVRNVDFYGVYVDTGKKIKIQVRAGDVYKLEKSNEKGMVVLAYQKGAKGRFLIKESIAQTIWNNSFDK